LDRFFYVLLLLINVCLIGILWWYKFRCGFNQTFHYTSRITPKRVSSLGHSVIAPRQHSYLRKCFFFFGEGYFCIQNVLKIFGTPKHDQNLKCF